MTDKTEQEIVVTTHTERTFSVKQNSEFSITVGSYGMTMRSNIFNTEIAIFEQDIEAFKALLEVALAALEER